MAKIKRNYIISSFWYSIAP